MHQTRYLCLLSSFHEGEGCDRFETQEFSERRGGEKDEKWYTSKYQGSNFVSKYRIELI